MNIFVDQTLLETSQIKSPLNSLVRTYLDSIKITLSKVLTSTKGILFRGLLCFGSKSQEAKPSLLTNDAFACLSEVLRKAAHLAVCSGCPEY